MAKFTAPIVLGRVALGPIVCMIPVLLAAACVDPGSLDVALGILAIPGVFVGRRKRDRIQTVDLVAIGHPIPVVVEILPIATVPLARVAGFTVAAVAEHPFGAFTRWIENIKPKARAGSVGDAAHERIEDMPAIGDAKVLIMASDRFEESELFGPRDILLGKGAHVAIAAPEVKDIMATVHDEPGKTIGADIAIADVTAADYDALLLPGGVSNPDHLRGNKDAIALIREFASTEKPIAAICHAPWLLIEADLLRGRKATSWPSIRTDLKNAGATVLDEEAVTDGNIITSRNPDDVPDFTEALIEAIEARA